MKVYDMVPHLWIKECLWIKQHFSRVTETITTLLVNSMGNWRVMCAGNSVLE